MTRLLLETPLSDEQRGHVEMVHEFRPGAAHDHQRHSRPVAHGGRPARARQHRFRSQDPARAGPRGGRAARAGEGPRAAAADRAGGADRCCGAIPGGCGRCSSICSATRSSSPPPGEVAPRGPPDRRRAGRAAPRRHRAATPASAFPSICRTGLFTPYAQADPSVPRLYGGSGLGLTICERLVGLMGGEIALSSRPGEGTASI